MTTNITIKRIGGEGSNGYWLATGLEDTGWSPDNGATWLDPEGKQWSDGTVRLFRLALKNHLDSLATEAEPAPEPETFTGDPIKDSWGDGVYESDITLVVVTGSDVIWYGKNVERIMILRAGSLDDDTYTKLSDDPAAIINPDLLRGG